jgi:hypothetical protein
VSIDGEIIAETGKIRDNKRVVRWAEGNGCGYGKPGVKFGQTIFL